VQKWRATISSIAKVVRYLRSSVLCAETLSMAPQPREAGDMDFMLRDAFHDVVSAAPDSARTWAALQARIATKRPTIRRPRLLYGTLGYLAPREWTLDWHLLSLGRMAR
jgi:hypothetical protein